MTTSLGIVEHEQADVVPPCDSTGEPTPTASAWYRWRTGR
jgi:hypothetical protein